MPQSSSLARLKWKCAFGASTSHAARHFSSCSAMQAIGPESPKYIEVPEPPQQQRLRRPRVKGILPVPRNLFREAVGGVDRPIPHLSLKDPAKHTRGSTESETTRKEWVQRMASKRKENLQQGMTELRDRRKRADEELASKVTKRRVERQTRLDQGQREDERLTSPTIIAAMQQPVTDPVLPDPDREKRLAAMAERVKADETLQAEKRKSALHTLYMRARHFITTEEQLNDAIDHAFGTLEAPVTWGGSVNGESVWYKGEPDNVQKIMDRANMGPSRSQDKSNYYTELTDRRLRRIAEELTGGKLE